MTRIFTAPIVHDPGMATATCCGSALLPAGVAVSRRSGLSARAHGEPSCRLEPPSSASPSARQPCTSCSTRRLVQPAGAIRRRRRALRARRPADRLWEGIDDPPRRGRRCSRSARLAGLPARDPVRAAHTRSGAGRCGRTGGRGLSGPRRWQALDRRSRLRHGRSAARLGAVWDAVREELARERGGPLARRGPAGHDGDELDSSGRGTCTTVIGARRVAGRDQRRGRRADGDALSRAAAARARCGRGRRAARRPLAARPGVLVESLAHRPRARAGRDRRPVPR